LKFQADDFAFEFVERLAAPLHFVHDVVALERRHVIVVKTLDRLPQFIRDAHLHLAIVRGVGAGAVLHTHSVWSTVLSGSHASQGGIAFEGYEMLKGLEGVRTHKHREWLPILENSQDMVELSDRVSKTLQASPSIHGFLLKEHGLYTWGAGLQEAKRHVEILEFLMEVLVRSGAAQSA